MRGRWGSISKLSPRPYQREALSFALEHGSAIVVLPTGTGKTLVGLLFAEHHVRHGRRVLVLEPTRLLVEQVAQYYQRYSDFDVEWGHGSSPSCWESAPIFVTTPEYALARDLDADVLVVDECHHAVGDDPLLVFLQRSSSQFRLGLTAFLPHRRKGVLVRLIGPVFSKDWSDPEVRPFVARWVADAYDTPLSDGAMAVYREIDRRYRASTGTDRIVLKSALNYLARDGPLALADSLRRGTRLAKLLSDLRPQVERLEPLHKISALRRVLDAHDFERAIIFVDRLVVARAIASELNALLLRGRVQPPSRDALESAEIIVSTSAGEEGLDLPSSDLLIVWSNTSSALRFIQRQGRVLRPVGRIPKAVVFLVTPETVDEDAFLAGIHRLRAAGIDVGPLAGAFSERLRRGTRRELLELLETPKTLEELTGGTGLPIATVREMLRMLCESGDVLRLWVDGISVYLRSDALSSFARRRPDLFEPDPTVRVRIPRKPVPSRITVIERRGDVEYVHAIPFGCRLPRGELLDLLKKHWSCPNVYRLH